MKKERWWVVVLHFGMMNLVVVLVEDLYYHTLYHSTLRIIPYQTIQYYNNNIQYHTIPYPTTFQMYVLLYFIGDKVHLLHPYLNEFKTSSSSPATAEYSTVGRHYIPHSEEPEKPQKRKTVGRSKTGDKNGTIRSTIVSHEMNRICPMQRTLIRHPNATELNARCM